MKKSENSQKYLSHNFVLVISVALELWRKPKPTKGNCAATATADDDDKGDDFDDYDNNNSQVRHFRFHLNFYK